MQGWDCVRSRSHNSILPVYDIDDLSGMSALMRLGGAPTSAVVVPCKEEEEPEVQHAIARYIANQFGTIDDGTSSEEVEVKEEEDDEGSPTRQRHP